MSSDKKEKLCKAFDKNMLEKDLKLYIELVSHPRHVCLKCGRVANKKKYLHKPFKIVKEEKSE